MDILFDILIQPLEYDFFIKALVGISLISVSCSLVSCFLVLKGWSLYGDALSHAVLPGIILALIFSVNIGVGIFGMALLVTFSIQYLQKTTVFSEQTVLMIVTSMFMGLGFLIYYTWPQGIRITEILFGKVIGLQTQDLLILGAITLAIVLAFSTLWKSFALVFFDYTFARINGLRVRWYELGFHLLIAATVMTSLRSVGALLIVSLLITPGAFAYIITKNIKQMFFISVALALVTAVFGMYVSYHFEISTGAVVISSQFLVFLLTFFIKYFGKRRMLQRQIKENINQISNTNSSRADFSASNMHHQASGRGVPLSSQHHQDQFGG